MLKPVVCFSKIKNFKQNEAGIQAILIAALSFSFGAVFQELIEDLCHFPLPLCLKSSVKLVFSPCDFVSKSRKMED